MLFYSVLYNYLFKKKKHRSITVLPYQATWKYAVVTLTNTNLINISDISNESKCFLCCAPDSLDYNWICISNNGAFCEQFNVELSPNDWTLCQLQAYSILNLLYNNWKCMFTSHNIFVTHWLAVVNFMQIFCTHLPEMYSTFWWYKANGNKRWQCRENHGCAYYLQLPSSSFTNIMAKPSFV